MCDNFMWHLIENMDRGSIDENKIDHSGVNSNSEILGCKFQIPPNFRSAFYNLTFPLFEVLSFWILYHPPPHTKSSSTTIVDPRHMYYFSVTFFQL